MSRDDAFLREHLAGVIRTDDFTERLWRVYESCGAQAGRHPVELGILRSDYMLDVPSGLPLQVEVNTVSTSFMSLSTRVQQMHRHVIRWGGLEASYGGGGDAESALPANGGARARRGYSRRGWRAAGDEGAKLLMVVQPGERNIFDQRLIAQRLWDAHGVRTTRATLAEIASEARVRARRRRHVDVPGRETQRGVLPPGYSPADYPTDAEWDARELLERSGAVKSPSAAMHLAGTKKVQQVLAAPGTLERFVKDPEMAAEMRRVFAGLYALDGEGAAEAVKLGLTDPERYVLKPQREGGGNNLYGEELRAALETFDPASKPGEPGNLSAYILMQRIFPPANRTLCLRNGELSELETLSELGVYGGYLRVGEEVVMNEGGGTCSEPRRRRATREGSPRDTPCWTVLSCAERAERETRRDEKCRTRVVARTFISTSRACRQVPPDPSHQNAKTRRRPGASGRLTNHEHLLSGLSIISSEPPRTMSDQTGRSSKKTRTTIKTRGSRVWRDADLIEIFFMVREPWFSVRSGPVLLQTPKATRAVSCVFRGFFPARGRPPDATLFIAEPGGAAIGTRVR